MKTDDKQKMEKAIFNMILNHDTLSEKEKQLLSGLPNNDLELKNLHKIAKAITNLPEKPMPLLLKMRLMNRCMGFHFHFWQIFLVLFSYYMSIFLLNLFLSKDCIYSDFSNYYYSILTMDFY